MCFSFSYVYMICFPELSCEFVLRWNPALNKKSFVGGSDMLSTAKFVSKLNGSRMINWRVCWPISIRRIASCGSDGSSGILQDPIDTFDYDEVYRKTKKIFQCKFIPNRCIFIFFQLINFTVNVTFIFFWLLLRFDHQSIYFQVGR